MNFLPNALEKITESAFILCTETLVGNFEVKKQKIKIKITEKITRATTKKKLWKPTTKV